MNVTLFICINTKHEIYFDLAIPKIILKAEGSVSGLLAQGSAGTSRLCWAQGSLRTSGLCKSSSRAPRIWTQSSLWTSGLWAKGSALTS